MLSRFVFTIIWRFMGALLCWVRIPKFCLADYTFPVLLMQLILLLLLLKYLCERYYLIIENFRCTVVH